MTEGSWCSGRSKNGALQVVGCVLAAFLFVTPGGASTWTVNDLEDAIDIDPGDGMCETASGTCSLRAAVMEANARPGDDIVIVSEGIHRLTIASGSGAAGGALEITEDLLIIGFGAGRTVVDASVTGTAFVVARSGSEPVQATLQRLTVTGATSGALFVDSGESLVLDHAEVRGNSSLSGGGLYVRGEVELDGTVVRDNEATGSGGGVFVSSGGTLRITGGSRIEANRAGDHGGGVYADGVVLVYDGAFLRNSAGASGGGICVTNVGGLSIAGNPARPLFSHNTAGGNGGGVYSWTEGPMARLIRWTDFVANISEGEGGGLEAVGAHEISGCAFRDNVAEGAGGGGARIDGSSVTASEFSGNRSSGPGSGLAVETDTLIVNCTVHGNLSGFNGAVHVAPGAWVTMRACTVTRNEGGGVLNNGALELSESIVYGNDGGDCLDQGVVSGGFNIDGDDSCVLTSTGDMPRTDPVLGPLAPRGGPTRTRPVLRGSPALDAVHGTGGVSEDQRGEARPADGDGDGIARQDIGAYELVVHPGDADGSGWHDAVDLAVEIALADDPQLPLAGDPDCTGNGFFEPSLDIPCSVAAIW